MLFELYIKDFILVDELKIRFQPGLNVLTGETGAGKSIIIKAIDIAMGGRASKDLLRPNSKKAEIELAFRIDDEETLANMRDNHGLDLAEEPYIVLKREILESGRSVSRLNGNVASIETIRSISRNLVDIHGQHEHQSLLKRENYLKLLDRSISKEHCQRADGLASMVSSINSLKRKMNELMESTQKNKREYDFYRFQKNEIDMACLIPGEFESLSQEYKYIKNGESIHKSCLETLSLISSNFEDHGNAMDLIGNAVASIGQVAGFSNDLSEMHASLVETRYRLEDISSNLRHFHENFSYEGDRLDYIENRLDLINGMKMKYGNTIDEILTYRDELGVKIDDFIHSDDKINEMREACEKLVDEYRKEARSVSSKRLEASTILCREILSELKDLNLEKATFSIPLNSDGNRIAPTGFDEVDFLISTNPGQSPKSLSKIASGGEISRIMLSMKVILAKSDTIGTVIFDEIDTGVSGRTAIKVSEKLFKTSQHTQVVCITHLPQIAVLGDHHMLIEKSTADGKTTTNLKSLNDSERIEEISRLLDGNADSEISANHAKGLIDTMSQKKADIIRTRKGRGLNEKT